MKLKRGMSRFTHCNPAYIVTIHILLLYTHCHPVHFEVWMKKRTYHFVLYVLFWVRQTPMRHSVYHYSYPYLFTIITRSLTPLTMNEWHVIRLSRTGRDGWLQIDNQIAVEGMAKGAYTQLTLTLDLFIGGHRNFDEVNQGVGMHKAFKGCLQKVGAWNLRIQKWDWIYFVHPKRAGYGIKHNITFTNFGNWYAPCSSLLVCAATYSIFLGGVTSN